MTEPSLEEARRAAEAWDQWGDMQTLADRVDVMAAFLLAQPDPDQNRGLFDVRERLVARLVETLGNYITTVTLAATADDLLHDGWTHSDLLAQPDPAEAERVCGMNYWNVLTGFIGVPLGQCPQPAGHEPPCGPAPAEPAAPDERRERRLTEVADDAAFHLRQLPENARGKAARRLIDALDDAVAPSADPAPPPQPDRPDGFVFTDEWRPPKKNEWWCSPDSGAHRAMYDYRERCHILLPVPDPPEGMVVTEYRGPRKGDMFLSSFGKWERCTTAGFCAKRGPYPDGRRFIAVPQPVETEAERNLRGGQMLWEARYSSTWASLHSYNRDAWAAAAASLIDQGALTVEPLPPLKGL